MQGAGHVRSLLHGSGVWNGLANPRVREGRRWSDPGSMAGHSDGPNLLHPQCLLTSQTSGDGGRGSGKQRCGTLSVLMLSVLTRSQFSLRGVEVSEAKAWLHNPCHKGAPRAGGP